MRQIALHKVHILIVLLILFSIKTFSQVQYPVTVTPILTPPYSLNLSDYCGFSSQNIMIQLAVNDLTIKNMPVKLRLTIETAGVTIENPPSFNTPPIYIDGGVAILLFGSDLKDNFNINNLLFKGYSKQAYQNTGQLPEGLYRFTV